jgi:hypothetical protein
MVDLAAVQSCVAIRLKAINSVSIRKDRFNQKASADKAQLNDKIVACLSSSLRLMQWFIRRHRCPMQTLMIRWPTFALSLIGTILSFAIATAQPVTVHQGGQADRLFATEGYVVETFASGLGKISAMARHADGTLYTADQKTGRIFRLIDRQQDGVVDIVQPLPDRFDRPSGLTLIGDDLFVSDRTGLWRMARAVGPRHRVADLRNARSKGAPHPIAALNARTLRLGLSREDGRAALIDIDIGSGHAMAVDQSDGTIIGFAKTVFDEDDAAPWAMLERQGQVWLGQTLSDAKPIDAELSALWLDLKTGYALIAHADGVFRSVTTLAGLGAQTSPLLSGPAGAQAIIDIHVDERGTFLADQKTGRVWKMRRQPIDKTRKVETESAPETPSETPQSRAPSTRPILPRGSAIDRASRLEPPIPISSQTAAKPPVQTPSPSE